jgi:hypothetical protein
VEALGKDQYNTYRKLVINDRTRPIHDPIKKNSLSLFRCPTRKTKNKQSGQIAMLKDDVTLSPECTYREGDIGTFFQHENHLYPASLSVKGKLRLGNKSDLLSVLTRKTQQAPPNTFDVNVFDPA